jgi:hypothetical protein
MGIHFLFIGNVAAHLVALMSGIATFGIAIWENIKKHPIRARSFWIVSAFFLLVAVDQAWQDEHRNSEVLIGQKSAVYAEKNACEQQQAIREAYTRGLEGNTLKQQQSIEEQRNFNSKQQDTLNTCVVSLVSATKPEKFAVFARGVRLPVSRSLPMFGRETFGTVIVQATRPIPLKGKIKCNALFRVYEAYLNSPDINVKDDDFPDKPNTEANIDLQSGSFGGLSSSLLFTVGGKGDFAPESCEFILP